MTVSLEKPAVTRPTIDFGTDSRATAREYAAAADSRVLPDEARTVLQAAARGEVVDAYDLNLALHHAMSSAATRLGQSMARRTLTSKIRHLVYIVNGVIENHVDEVPVYEGGPRSPRIHALEIEVEHAGVVNQSLTRDLTTEREKVEALRNERALLTQAASDERRRLCAEIDQLRAEVRKATLSEQRMALVLTYAFEHMPPESTQRVLGFWDGIEH